MIEIKNLSVCIDNNKLIDDVSFVLREGEIVSVIGQNGSGKTVLLRTIAGLVKNYSGNIIVNSGLYGNKKEMTAAYFPDYSDIDNDETVYNHAIFKVMKKKPLWKTVNVLEIERVKNLLSDFGLSEYLNNSTKKLSDSVLKMLYISDVVSSGKKLLLMDNPDTVLDYRCQNILRKEMLKFVMNGTGGIIFTTNNVNFAVQLSDRIIVLKNGCIHCSGTDDIISEELIREIYGCESFVNRNVITGKKEVYVNYI